MRYRVFFHDVPEIEAPDIETAKSKLLDLLPNVAWVIPVEAQLGPGTPGVEFKETESASEVQERLREEKTRKGYSGPGHSSH